jgi:CubicO group peptidase (beta-lactamase class C family)
MIDKLAKIPLLYQPGTKWIYSMSMDIEGYIVEKLSGQSLPDFMRDQIFTPLGMRDAGFYVPDEKRDRLATLYKADADGKLVVDPAACCGMHARFKAQPTMPSGGGGLVSTTEDYYRFAQMFLNHGQLNGVRILAPSSIQLMDTNHIPIEHAHRRVSHRHAISAAGLRLRLQRRRRIRSAARRPARWQRHVRMGRSRRNLVLDRSHQRRRLYRNDSAHDGRFQPQPRIHEPRPRLSGLG